MRTQSTAVAASAPADTSNRTARTVLFWTGAGLVLVVLAFLVLLGGLRAARAGEVLPGVRIAEVAVGELDRDALDSRVAELAVDGETRPIQVHAGRTEVTSTAGDAGWELDAEATADAAWSRGRQLNPFASLADHLRAFGGGVVIDPALDLDEARLRSWASSTAGEMESDPVEASIAFSGADVEVTHPQPGVDVDQDALVAAVDAELRSSLIGPPLRIEAQADITPTEVSAEEAERAADEARLAVSAPIVLTGEDTEGDTLEFALSPEALGGILRVDREGSALTLVADPAAVRRAVPTDVIERLEVDPVDASFETDGSTATVVPGRDGFRFDSAAAADQIVEVATGTGSRTAALVGEVVEAELTTAEAEALGITEQVSSFTTNFEAGQSRVQNIHRMAELVDGELIRPGETFSVNDHVGPRTREKGFTDGGAIHDGEFITAVGGGVSQFATTMYNAAYFGGYDIPDYKAHSYYISRYPEGREATLNYPDVDLKVRNNSPHGILVRTSFTATSVTVSFYGTKWVEVDSETGGRHNITSPPIQERENPAMAPGTERVVQSGREGFDVTVTRILRFPDGREEREQVSTRYLPEPRIIERGPPPPPPEPEPPPEEPPPEEPPPEPPPEEPPPPPPEEPPPPGDDGGEAPPGDPEPGA